MVVRRRRDEARMGLGTSVTRRAEKIKREKVSFYELILWSEDYYVYVVSESMETAYVQGHLRGWPLNSWEGEGGVGWVISGHQDFFFSSNLVGRIFFSLLNTLQDIFSLLISLQDFFSSKKGHVFTYTKCIYIYIVVIAVIVLIWSCKALKCCKLYKIIIV